MGRRQLVWMAVVACTVMLAASCSQTLQGNPVSVFDDPFSVAGMPAVDGPSGLRPDTTEPSRDVINTDGGEIDMLAASAISDIEEFWAGVYGDTFDGDFVPVSELISWDAYGFDGYFCDLDTYGLANAAFCNSDGSIGWDRGELLPALRDAYGDMGVTLVLAHEYGHAIQSHAGLIRKGTATLVAEQRADCLAGAYMRWVAEGSSSRFALGTGDGLNNVLAAVIAFRDPLLKEDDLVLGIDEHGSAFERVSAFQFGFTDGASSCASIDLTEIAQRRGDLPVLLPENQTGELAVTEDSAAAIVDAMTILFEPAAPPQLSFAAEVASDCPDARPSPPVSYCPATNTLVVDLPELQVMGAQIGTADNLSLANGDNTAYSVLMSRYTLAVQQERGVELDTAEAALRTACLTGVATMKMTSEVTTPDGDTIALTAGDIDEALSGMLTNGLVASDVNGESVPSGFSRIDAFRLGVLSDEDRCFRRFP